MLAHLPLHTVYLLISALLTLTASIIAWRRTAPGSFSLSLLLLSMTVWSGFYALELLPLPMGVKILLPNIIYIGVVAVPTLFLIFALSYTNHEGWFGSHLLFALAVEPIIILIMVWTNSYHNLVTQSIAAPETVNLSALEGMPGPWYEVNVAYSYMVIVAGLTVLIYGMARSSPLLKNQYRIILLASLFPWGVSLYSEYFIKPDQFDWTPITFGLSGIFFTYSVIRNRFMDIIPVARSRLIESMSDGVLVLDMQNYIVDINPAMEHILGHKPASLLGKPASEALDVWMGQTELVISGEQTSTELRTPNSPFRYLDLRMTPLYDNYQHLNGRLMVFRDVTDRKQNEKKLRHANDRLQSQLIEIGLLQSKLRSQAIRDPLTDLFNRRYLDETLDRELARATREDYPVCVIMMDIDHFKKVNDTYGHEAGDIILKTLANALSTRNRRGDFTCRFGGEEFVVVMPNIAIETAYQRAQDLRILLNSLQIPYGLNHLAITISMGIACFPSNGDDRESILRAADRAMYAAKNAGRDHILTYNQLEAQRETLVT
ncbi:MAG: diguanylate cyclase [Chloroflexota bacterium]